MQAECGGLNALRVALYEKDLMPREGIFQAKCSGPNKNHVGWARS